MSVIANRYAKSFADVVEEHGEITQARDAIHGFNQVLVGHQELQAVFYNPTIPQDQKRGILNALIQRLNLSKTTGNFLSLLLQNYRLHQLGDIVAAFDREIDRRLGVVTAEVTTAAPITEQERHALSKKLDQMTGKQVRLQFKIDPQIIGGVVTRIGSVIYDGSIRNQLQQIEVRLRGE
ncbi:MAG TPA: ATP synthase F1 subunit delta [Blastocatellia bacterium]|nr:ATP synthase F1 subunit delta [Blastocatellia bacterium]